MNRAGATRTVAWAITMLLGIAALGLLGFILAIGAERATPRPSDLHLTINRIVVGSGLLALCLIGAAGIASPSRRRAALWALAGCALLFGLLTLALIEQQG